MMKIAHDASGKVWLTGSGPFPADLNGEVLTTHELSAEQQVEFSSLPSMRSGTVFDGENFVALPNRPAPVSVPRPTLEDVISVLTDEQKARLGVHG